MTDEKRQDAQLRAILRRNDPAAPVAPGDSARLEMFIWDRVALQPQDAPCEALPFTASPDFFAIPRLLGGALSWSATMAGTMILGLLLGVFVSSIADRPASYHAAYNVAMIGPWHQLMQ